jgi:hypothetical protein
VLADLNGKLSDESLGRRVRDVSGNFLLALAKLNNFGGAGHDLWIAGEID